MPAPLHIRRYDDTDRDAVWALHNTALQAIEAHAGNGPWDEDLHHIPAVYLDSGGEFLVGVAGDQLVGMGALLPHPGGVAEIKRMRVRPGAQRRGYGQAILHALEAAATERGFHTLILDTTTAQAAAHALYSREGYAEARRSRLGPFTLIHFEKTLRPRP